MPKRVALLTAGGYAPCLSSAVGALIETYDATDPEIELIAYRHGYHGLLTGNYVLVDEEARKHAAVLHRYRGSPIGNSRVKLTNKKNLVERGLVAEDEDPLQKAAEQLRTLMRAVVTDGTAKNVGFSGDVHGKTGTAEYGEYVEDEEMSAHGWFVGIQGDLAFAVFVNNAGSSAPAVEAAGRLLR